MLRSTSGILVSLGVLVAALAAARLAIGGVDNLPPEVLRHVLEIRGLRVAMGMVVGAGLAVAGALLQGLMRNPLASPDLLGVASGAGLGVMGAVYVAYLGGAGLAAAGAWGGLGAGGAAVAGALVTLAIVYAISQRGWAVVPTTLVLMGVIVGIVCAGVTAFLQHLMPDQGVAAQRLLVGALRDDATWTLVGAVGAVVLACVVVSMAWAASMDAASFSDDEARSVGVRLGRLRTVQFVCAGVLTAGAVVLAGPIGFVGLLAPHGVRALAGPGARTLLVGSALLGAALVVGADVLVALVREVHPGLGRLPLGVVTALIGGPLFLLMLRRTPVA